PTWLPFHGQTPIAPNYATLAGGRMFLAALLDGPSQILVPLFALFGGWFLLRLLLRRPLLAAIALALITTMTVLGGENPVLEVPGAVFTGLLMAFTITRFGLLAMIALFVVRWLILITPLPFSATSPYAFQAVACLLL